MQSCYCKKADEKAKRKMRKSHFHYTSVRRGVPIKATDVFEKKQLYSVDIIGKKNLSFSTLKIRFSFGSKVHPDS